MKIRTEYVRALIERLRLRPVEFDADGLCDRIERNIGLIATGIDAIVAPAPLAAAVSSAQPDTPAVDDSTGDGGVLVAGYACERCGRTFATAAGLNGHQRAHGAPPLTDAHVALIDALRAEGGSQTAVAARLHRSIGTINSMIRTIRTRGSMPADVAALLDARALPRRAGHDAIVARMEADDADAARTVAARIREREREAEGQATEDAHEALLAARQARAQAIANANNDQRRGVAS